MKRNSWHINFTLKLKEKDRTYWSVVIIYYICQKDQNQVNLQTFINISIINPFKTMSMMASSSTKDTIPFFKWLDAHFVKVA